MGVGGRCRRTLNENRIKIRQHVNLIIVTNGANVCFIPYNHPFRPCHSPRPAAHHPTPLFGLFVFAMLRNKWKAATALYQKPNCSKCVGVCVCVCATTDKIFELNILFEIPISLSLYFSSQRIRRVPKPAVVCVRFRNRKREREREPFVRKARKISQAASSSSVRCAPLFVFGRAEVKMGNAA